jgi:putative transport protein
MDALKTFFAAGHTAQCLVAFALVACVGLALARVRLRGVGVGVAGVLFAGLLCGRLGVEVDPHVLEFMREFGLILFVFSIGLQLGPGFFASLRRTGLKLNLLAAANVLLGVALAIGVWKLAGLPLPVAAGLLSGATTNTPSLAAAAQALAETGADAAALAQHGSAYALAYPFGVFGVIAAMLLARRFLPKPGKASAAPAAEPSVLARNLEIRNPALAGRPLGEAFPSGHGLTVSRLRHGDATVVPTTAQRLALGDILLVVGETAAVQQAALLAGGESAVDLRALEGPVTNRRLIVTHREVVGRSLAALQLQARCGVAATRLARQGIEFVPEPGLRVQFGDVLTLVGADTAIADAARLLGDSPKELEHTRVGPLFFGILLGVLVGLIPIALPGLPAPVRLGLAGGPLVVAILLGRLGSLGPLVWYVPANASLALREIGIVLFLACVGLKSGDAFFTHLLDGSGLAWMGLAAAITFIPVVLTAWFARRHARMPIDATCGLLAGSMTDPPALAFAQQAHPGSGTAIAYATVYPLTMLLRVLTAQVLVFVLS